MLRDFNICCVIFFLFYFRLNYLNSLHSSLCYKLVFNDLMSVVTNMMHEGSFVYIFVNLLTEYIDTSIFKHLKNADMLMYSVTRLTEVWTEGLLSIILMIKETK